MAEKDQQTVTRRSPSAKLSTFVEMAERALAHVESVESAGQWRAELEAKQAAELDKRAELATPGRRARGPHDRTLAPATSSPTPRARARGSSGSARRRARRADEARRERLRASLVRRGAPSSTPTPAAVPWHLTKRAARVWHDGQGHEARKVLNALPGDVARRLRALASTIRSRAKRRRLIASYCLLLDIGDESRRGGSSWKVVATFCRAMLCAMLPASELVDAEGGTLRPIDENTWTSYMSELVAGGLLEVRQPGGPETAAERDVLVGPSGWALAQYRLLWFRPPGNTVQTPALQAFPSSKSASSLPASSSLGSNDAERSCGPPE